MVDVGQRIERFETRGARLEVRGDAAEASRAPRLEGYAALFGVPSQPLRAEAASGREGIAFTEVIRPGAFARAVAAAADVRCLWNHEPDGILGRTAAGTLELREDADGLWFGVDLPATQLGRDVAELVRRGDVTQCSFAFRAVRDAWTGTAATGYVRELLDVDLYDVGPVTWPAYAETTVAVRSWWPGLPDEGAAGDRRAAWTRARARARLARSR